MARGSEGGRLPLEWGWGPGVTVSWMGIARIKKAMPGLFYGLETCRLEREEGRKVSVNRR